MTSTNPDLLWWQTGVIYQVYPRSFKDSNGDGIGDLAGIIQKLDYLAEVLGVNAIWLSPFYPSPMADFGYDVANYTDVDPIFGDMATFEKLVDEAHHRELKIIIDFVPNHTSDQHPWFQESRDSREDPKRDWYVWADPRPNGDPPNNWLSVFGGSAWEWEPGTKQYYLHSFLKEQPDLNWRNSEVKAAMFDVLRFWLEKGVDGFRIDVAHFIMKDPLLRDNPLKDGTGLVLHKSLGEYDTLVHLYDHDHPDIHDVYRDLRLLLESYSHEYPRVSIGELFFNNWEKWAAYFGRNLDELHLPFNFHLLGAPWTAPNFRQVVEVQEAALPKGAWPNYVLGNHDEGRIASRIGLDAARVAAMLLLTLRGTPTLYYGDEIGMTNGDIPLEDQQDPFGIRVPGLGRDPCRTPMQWTAESNAGFSPQNIRQIWLPIDKNYQQVNVARQLEDPGSVLNLYRQLLAFRKNSPALQWGGYLPIESTQPDIYAYLREATGQQTLLVALNFSPEPIELELPKLNQGQLILTTYLDHTGPLNLSSWSLRGNEGALIQLGGV